MPQEGPPINPDRRRKLRGVGCLAFMVVGLAALGFLGVSLAGFSGSMGGLDRQISEVVEAFEPSAKKKIVII